MNLYLVQHGLALDEAEAPGRPLSPAGAAEVETVAEWAAARGLRVRQIRHSGKLRAQQTAERLAGALSPERGCVAVAGLGPNDEVRSIARGDLDAVMLVGHLPFLARLAGWLILADESAAPVRFRNAGIVCLAGGDGGWALEWAVVPALLGT